MDLLDKWLTPSLNSPFAGKRGSDPWYNWLGNCDRSLSKNPN